MSAFTPRRVGREAMLALCYATQQGHWAREARFMSAASGKLLASHGLIERTSGTSGRSGVPAKVRLTAAGYAMCRKWIVDDVTRLVLP